MQHASAPHIREQHTYPIQTLKTLHQRERPYLSPVKLCVAHPTIPWSFLSAIPIPWHTIFPLFSPQRPSVRLARVTRNRENPSITPINRSVVIGSKLAISHPSIHLFSEQSQIYLKTNRISTTAYHRFLSLPANISETGKACRAFGYAFQEGRTRKPTHSFSFQLQRLQEAGFGRRRSRMGYDAGNR